jgi:hypothetical protein
LQDTIVQKVFYARDNHEKADLLIGAVFVSVCQCVLCVYVTEGVCVCMLIHVIYDCVYAHFFLLIRSLSLSDIQTS